MKRGKKLPLPQRKDKESKKDFISRCMSNSKMNEEYPNQDQRLAVCNQQAKGGFAQQVSDRLNEDD